MNFILELMAKLGLTTATAALSNASQWHTYQEEEPKDLASYF